MSASPTPNSDSSDPQAEPISTGPAPLARGESIRNHHDLIEHIHETLQPRDGLERLWIVDIAELAWEAFRLRRAKAGLMTLAASSTVDQAQVKHAMLNCPGGNAEKLREAAHRAHRTARKWTRGDADVAAEVEAALASRGLTMELVLARATSTALKQIQVLDRMLASVESRRSAALRELDHHRANLGQDLRRAIAEAEIRMAPPTAPRLAPAHPA
jgi:hypothetical protein